MISWARRHPLALLVVIAAVVAGSATSWWTFLDLTVYRFGGRTVLDGLPLYAAGEPRSGLLFTYPPFSALLMTLLSAPPLWAAAAAWTALGVAALGVTLWSFVRESGRSPSPMWVAVACAGAMLLDPVRETLMFGQVNLVLMALVSYDLLVLRGRLSGVLVGIAAGIKLTPLVFVVLLVLVGRRAAALRAVSAFAATILVGVVLLPSDAAAYWTHELWDAGRVGGVEYVRNQSLLGAMTRLGHQEPSSVAWLLVAVPAGLALLALAAAWWRRGARDLGVLLTAGAMLLCSPISWDHHWVWSAPVLVVLWHRGARWLGVAVGAFLLTGPRLLVENGERSELTWQPVQQLAGNGYLWLAMVLAGVAAYALRAGTTRPATSPSVSRPPAVLGAE